MKSWDAIDITDILKAHHKELSDASKELSEGGDYEALASKLDDKCIVIEQYLETNHNIEWTGVKFKQHAP